MILSSHNSWSYLPARKWWMKLIAFTAKCQRKSIAQQYNDYGVRCFDLRVRFDNKGKLIVAHGLIEYKIDKQELLNQLNTLDSYGDTYVRILHEVRSKKQLTEKNKLLFQDFCREIASSYLHINFWCGRNLATWEYDYRFGNEPTCIEMYASVCRPKLIDDWWPWLYAILHNRSIRKIDKGAEILMIDYVDIK